MRARPPATIDARLRGALVVAQLLLVAACAATSAPSASTGLSRESSETNATPSAEASGSASDDDLGTVAWWATENLGFGVIPEAPPDPNPAVQPEGFRQLTIGTLDGRVTAVLALHWDWGHSYVAGPYGTDVLVADDTGTASEVFLVSALDGTRTDLFTSPEIVAAAALGDGGRSVYYVELARAGLADRGLWRRAIGGSDPVQILPGPLAEEMPDPSVWWLTADPLEGRVVVQSCFGEVRCTTVAVDPRTGLTHEDSELGWPLGADATTFFGDGLGASDDAYALDVNTGTAERLVGASASVPVASGVEWRFVRAAPGEPEGATVVVSGDGQIEAVPGEELAGSVMHPLGERRGVALPPGWVLRWPQIPIQQTNGPMGPSGIGQLIDIETATRVALPPFELAVPLGAPCEVPVPPTMPSGRPLGFGVVELVNGAWTVRWGGGADTVAVGIDIGLEPTEPELDDGAPVEVRGHPGRAILIGDEGVGETAFTWCDEACTYTVWLPSGTTLEETLRYAQAY